MLFATAIATVSNFQEVFLWQKHKPHNRPGSNFIELLKQTILLVSCLLAEMSRIPVTKCTCDMVVWLVTFFW